MFGKLRRRKADPAPIPGCDPELFAEEIVTFLQRAAGTAAEDRLERQTDFAQRGQQVRHLAHALAAGSIVQHRETRGTQEAGRRDDAVFLVDHGPHHVEMNHGSLGGQHDHAVCVTAQQVAGADAGAASGLALSAGAASRPETRVHW